MPESTKTAPPSRTTRPRKPRRRGRPAAPAAIIAVGAALTVVFVGSIVLVVCAVFDATRAGSHWAAFTGPIGDTFGGILGPILNAAVLASTVYLAVWWQPRKDRERKQSEDARELASKVVAWMAETDEDAHLGVVVSNSSDSVAHNVDILVAPDGNGARRLIDREATVPPGTWFVPLSVPSGSGDSRSSAVGWKLPVSVDTAKDLSVVLGVTDAEGDAERAVRSEEFTLRPHLPEMQDGEKLPHYVLQELRYVLHGKAWRRNESGRIDDAPELDEDEERLRDAAMRTARVSAQPRAMSRRVRPDVERLIRHTLALACTTVAEPGVDVFAAAATKPQKVDASILPGVAEISHSGTKGGSLTLHLIDGTRRVRLMPVLKSFPADVFVVDERGTELRTDGGKKISYWAKKAGAGVNGKANAGDLARAASEWLASPASEATWLLTLRAIVTESAARPIIVSRDNEAANAADAAEAAETAQTADAAETAEATEGVE